MKIVVKRKWLEIDSTISEILVDGEFLCYGLEDAVREVEGDPVESWKVYGKTAIPYGTYPVEITRSARWKKDMLQIMDVPGFAGIRIHAGNTAADTDGCLLVGTTRDDDFIVNSRLALVRLYGMVQAALGNGEDVAISFVKG